MEVRNLHTFTRKGSSWVVPISNRRPPQRQSTKIRRSLLPWWHPFFLVSLLGDHSQLPVTAWGLLTGQERVHTPQPHQLSHMRPPAPSAASRQPETAPAAKRQKKGDIEEEMDILKVTCTDLLSLAGKKEAIQWHSSFVGGMQERQKTGDTVVVIDMLRCKNHLACIPGGSSMEVMSRKMIRPLQRLH